MIPDRSEYILLLLECDLLLGLVKLQPELVVMLM